MSSIELLTGRVQPGKNDASHWLTVFNAAYAHKTGMPIFPGSLNLLLAQPFDWYCAKIQSSVIEFGRAEYGGERDTFLLPCILPKLDARKAFLWSTTTNARAPDNPCVVEIITDVKLRERYGLNDGDAVEVELQMS